MTTEQFTYWLQGYFEISNNNTLSEEQVQVIKDHLNLVFKKVTPDRNKSLPEENSTLEPRDSKSWDLTQKICESEKPHRINRGNGPVVYC